MLSDQDLARVRMVQQVVTLLCLFSFVSGVIFFRVLFIVVVCQFENVLT